MTSQLLFATDSARLHDVMGPRIEFTTPVAEGDGYCLFRSVIPPGVQVGIHSHPDRETMFLLDGKLDGLLGEAWATYGPGDTIDIPGDLPHAFRNTSGKEVQLLLVSTMQMGRFFREIAAPSAVVSPGPPSPGRLERFISAALRYKYWLGAVEDNNAVGLHF